MNRKQLEKIINAPTRTFRKQGRVVVELDATNDPGNLHRFPYAGRGNNIAEAIDSFLRAHKIEA